MYTALKTYIYLETEVERCLHLLTKFKKPSNDLQICVFVTFIGKSTQKNVVDMIYFNAI